MEQRLAKTETSRSDLVLRCDRLCELVPAYHRLSADAVVEVALAVQANSDHLGIHSSEIVLLVAMFHHQHGGAVIVRLNLTNLPLTEGEGQPLAWLPHLRTLETGRVGDWPVAVREDKKGLPLITGRVCAIKKEQDGGRAQPRQGW